MRARTVLSFLRPGEWFHLPQGHPTEPPLMVKYVATAQRTCGNEFVAVVRLRDGVICWLKDDTTVWREVRPIQADDEYMPF